MTMDQHKHKCKMMFPKTFKSLTLVTTALEKWEDQVHSACDSGATADAESYDTHKQIQSQLISQHSM